MADESADLSGRAPRTPDAGLDDVPRLPDAPRIPVPRLPDLDELVQAAPRLPDGPPVGAAPRHDTAPAVAPVVERTVVTPAPPPGASSATTPDHTVLATAPSITTESAPKQRRQGAGPGFWIPMTVLLVAVGGLGYWGWRQSGASAEVASSPSEGATAASVATTVPTVATSPPATALPTIPVIEPTLDTLAIIEPLMVPLAPRPVDDGVELGVAEYVATYFDTADFDAPRTQYEIRYEQATDELFARVSDDGEVRRPFVWYQGGWRYEWAGEDFQRHPRSPASLDPSPDHRLASRLTQDDVVPPSARPFTRVVSRAEQDVLGEVLTVLGVQLDADAFAAAHPDEHASWIDRWSDQDDLGDSSIVPSGRQVIRDGEFGAADTTAGAFLDDSVLREIDAGGQAFAVIGFRDTGTVAYAAVSDPARDLLTVYMLLSDPTTEAPRISGFDEQDWVDAPNT